jgi:signal transduction histidine kinase
MPSLVAAGLTPLDRRRALRTGAGVVAVAGVLDVALLTSPLRAGVWIGWFVLLLATGEAIARVAPGAIRAVGAGAAVISTVALVVLVHASGGSGSPFFSVLPLLPALGAIIAPEDDETAPVLATVIPVAGIALLAAEGRSPGWIALWAAPVILAGLLVVRVSREHRRRREIARRAAEERADALDRLARSERELARVERLARLPLLADGVAHDLNSPLAVVSSTIAFARIEVRGEKPELEEAFADAADAVATMKRVVGDLQRLARLELDHAGDSPSRATELALREAVQYVAAQLAEGRSPTASPSRWRRATPWSTSWCRWSGPSPASAEARSWSARAGRRRGSPSRRRGRCRRSTSSAAIRTCRCAGTTSRGWAAGSAPAGSPGSSRSRRCSRSCRTEPGHAGATARQMVGMHGAGAGARLLCWNARRRRRAASSKCTAQALAPPPHGLRR